MVSAASFIAVNKASAHRVCPLLEFKNFSSEGLLKKPSSTKTEGVSFLDKTTNSESDFISLS